MKTYLFIFLICPIVLFAQNQQTPAANGATDCPTFGKKNTFSKAGLFQYMRTHKPQRIPDTQQQQTVYRSSALPDLKQAQEERDLAEKQSQERVTSKKQRKERNRPVISEEPQEAEPATRAVAKADPVKEETKTPVIADSKKEEPENSEVDSSLKKESASAEASADEAREKREKKMKKVAFKAKMQHLFKRSKKSSRKNDQKCPTF